MSERDRLRAILASFAAAIPEDLRAEVTIVGGTALALFDMHERVELRATKDIDIVVPASTYAEWRLFVDRFEDAGFRFVSGEDTPICRYARGDLVVDILPHKPNVLSFQKSAWFDQAPMRRSISSFVTGLPVVDVSLLVALKCEAFLDRGAADPNVSKDLEDIVAIIMNHDRLFTLLDESDIELRRFVVDVLRNMFDGSNGATLFSSHLPGDDATQERGEEQLTTMLKWARNFSTHDADSKANDENQT